MTWFELHIIVAKEDASPILPALTQMILHTYT